ncbi:unnamed protein product, partial [Brenthis ino]
MGRKRKSTRRMRESDDSEHSESGSLVRRRHKSRRRYNKSQTRDSSSGSDVPRHCRVSKKRRRSRRCSETPQRRTVPRGHNGTPDPGTTQRRNVSRGRDVTRDPGTPPRRDVLRNHEEYQNPEELQSTHLLQNEYAAGTSQPATIPAVTPTVSAPQINVSTDFNANVLALAFKELIQTMKTDGATPRANGQVERYNRTVLAALTATNHSKPDNLWDECVSEIQWGLNNTQNKGTGKSPAQALFGLDLVGTSGSLLQLSVTDSADNVDTPIEDIRREMTEQIRDNQDKQKQRFDKIRKEVTYNIGDLVRIEREISSTGNSRKLIPKLRGPYRIKEVLDNDRYVVEDTPLSRKGNRNFSSIFSVDKIHPWMVFNRADTESETSNNDDADELEVR